MIIIRILISILISSRIRISITIQKFSAGKKNRSSRPLSFHRLVDDFDDDYNGHHRYQDH